jgi:hypothetical protein
MPYDTVLPGDEVLQQSCKSSRVDHDEGKVNHERRVGMARRQEISAEERKRTP